MPARAESRFALVIGNGAYKNVPALSNPPNDAEDVAATLKSLGFKVTLKLDLDLAAMQRAIDEFALRSVDADVSLFYYAGHGLQLAGRNYLVPVGAELRKLDDLATRMVALDPVLAELGKGRGLHLVFLDACRNNPFAGAGVALPAPGLARVGKLPGFFITFATQPDNVAFDGRGRNSPFATAFLAHLATPGADISSMMIAVRNDVFAATGGQQIPADESLLTKQFYFAGATAAEETLETQLWRLSRKGPRPEPAASLSRPLPRRTSRHRCPLSPLWSGKRCRDDGAISGRRRRLSSGRWPAASGRRASPSFIWRAIRTAPMSTTRRR